MHCKYCGDYIPSIFSRRKFCSPECGKKYRELEGLSPNQLPFDFVKAAINQSQNWQQFNAIIKEATCDDLY